MPKATIQITINVEYEQVHSDSNRVLDMLVRQLEDRVHQSVGSGMLSPPATNDEYDVETWDVKIKTIDPEKERAQFQAIRNDNFIKVEAFFSSDGPALSLNFHPNVSVEDIDAAIINGALREAFHKYRAHVREGK